MTGPGSFTGPGSRDHDKDDSVCTEKASRQDTADAGCCGGAGRHAGVPDHGCKEQPGYTALYKPKNGLMENLSAHGPHFELAKQIGEKYPGTNILFAGDGVPLHMDFLKIELKERCSFMPPFTYQAMAAPAAQLALTLHARGESADCTGLVPFYLRPSQAEREYEKRHAQESREHGSSIGQ